MSISILPVVQDGQVERFVLLRCDSGGHQSDFRFAVPEDFFRKKGRDNDQFRCSDFGRRIYLRSEETDLAELYRASDSVINHR